MIFGTEIKNGFDRFIGKALNGKTWETGRSMVEILGVLSLIGVLSVIGIFGYSKLMEKHRDNQLLQGMTMRAYTVSTQMLAGQEPTLSGFSDNLVGHMVALHAAPTASAYVDEETGEEMSFRQAALSAGDEEFSLGATNVTPRVCQLFVELVNGGLAQKVVDSSGSELTMEKCNSLASSGSSVSLSSVTTEKGTSEGGSTLYVVYRSDMSRTKAKEIEESFGGSLSISETSCNGKGNYGYVSELGMNGCKCNEGWSGENCSQKEEKCSANGWFVVTPLTDGKCICKDGFGGESCGEKLGYSPCQTLDENGERTVLEDKSNCYQSGKKGKCSGGYCKVRSLTCSSNDTCEKLKGRQFCNVFGETGVCEVVNPREFELEGKTYYYNTDKDLRSWCRPADGKPNCDNGFLTFSGAENWCQKLGAKLVDGNLINGKCAEFKKHLPQVMENQQYWVSGEQVVYLKDCSIKNSGKEAAGVVCVDDGELLELSEDEKNFLDEMQQLNDLLKDRTFDTSLEGGLQLDVLNSLKSLSVQVFEAYNAKQLGRFQNLKNSYSSRKPTISSELNTLLDTLKRNDINYTKKAQ